MFAVTVFVFLEAGEDRGEAPSRGVGGREESVEWGQNRHIRTVTGVDDVH